MQTSKRFPVPLILLSQFKSPIILILIGATALIALVVIVLPYSGPIARLFQLTPLPWPFWLLLVGILLAYGFCAELVKRWFYHARGSRR